MLCAVRTSLSLVAATRGASRSVQDLRNAASAFVKAIHAVSPDAQIALVMFAAAPTTAVDFTKR
jgi:hypothetical protein